MMEFPHVWFWRLNGILRKVVSLPSPPSRLRGVPPLSEKKVDVGAHRVLLTKFREVHYINFISR